MISVQILMGLMVRLAQTQGNFEFRHIAHVLESLRLTEHRALADPGVLANAYPRPHPCLLTDGNVQAVDTMNRGAVGDGHYVAKEIFEALPGVMEVQRA